MSPFLIIFGAYLAIYPWIPSAHITPKFLLMGLGVAVSPFKLAAGPLRPPLLGGVGAAVLSGVLSGNPPVALAGHSNCYAMGAAGVLLVWLCYEAGRARSSGVPAWTLVAACAAASAIAAILQTTPFGVAWLAVGEMPDGRVYGLAGSPPFLGAMLALALPLAWGIGPWTRIALLYAAVLSGSRAGLVGAAVAALTLLWGPRKSLLASGGALAAALAALPRLDSDAGRLQAWGVAAKAVASKPLLGWGMDGFSDAFFLLRDPVTWGTRSHQGMESAHNLILDVLVSAGVVGAAAGAWLAYIVLKRGYPRPVVASVLGVLAYGMFNPTPFTAFAVLAYVMGEADARI